MTHMESISPLPQDGEVVKPSLEPVKIKVLYEMLTDPDAVSAMEWAQQSRLLLRALARHYEGDDDTRLLWARLGVLPDQGAVAAKKLVEESSPSQVLARLREPLLDYAGSMRDVETKNAVALFVIGDPNSEVPSPLTAMDIQRRYGAVYPYGLHASHYVAAGLATIYEQLARGAQ